MSDSVLFFADSAAKLRIMIKRFGLSSKLSPQFLWSLQTMSEEITVDPAIAEPARMAVERMTEMSKNSD